MHHLTPMNITYIKVNIGCHTRDNDPLTMI